MQKRTIRNQVIIATKFGFDNDLASGERLPKAALKMTGR